ncbi:MAG: hypothetical protein Q9200_001924 [Gallowayella weberi]
MVHNMIWLAFQILHLVLAATIPNQPTVSTQSTNDTKASFEYTGPVESQLSAQCDGANFGSRLNETSCLDAWTRLPVGDDKAYLFGQRGSGLRAQFPLPSRSSSRDGRCVIDVVHRINGPARDYVSLNEIRRAAGSVLLRCVHGDQMTKRGGFVATGTWLLSSANMTPKSDAADTGRDSTAAKTFSTHSPQTS